MGGWAGERKAVVRGPGDTADAVRGIEDSLVTVQIGEALTGRVNNGEWEKMWYIHGT